MWREALIFISLALLSSTAFPLSFDPVLIYFASGHSLQQASIFAVGGSLCAGIAGIADLKLLGWLKRLVPGKLIFQFPNCKGRWFYLLISLLAFSPLPFFLVRLAILDRKANPFLYGLAIGLGRLP